jgi:hypothetical protein
MSLINIKRAVDNIKVGTTTVYSPVVELIVNAIQAIHSKKEKDGKVTIVVQRSAQLDIDIIPAVTGFEVIDNGIGFTDENRDAFDTLYTDQKIAEGGKGFGRFICLKYFNDLSVASHYQVNGAFLKRTFLMGKQNEIVVSEQVDPSNEKDSGSIVRLLSVKNPFPDKGLPIIARNIVEKILPYFITKDYACPTITIREKNESGSIVLNEYVNNELVDFIKEIEVPVDTFDLIGQKGVEAFNVRVFKFYSPAAQRSKISLVANKREVTATSIYKHIPEFIDEFYDSIRDGDNVSRKNFIIKAYVFGDYLDRHVSLERGGFEFMKDDDLFHGIAQNQIERKASAIARGAVGEEITARKEKKREHVTSYVEEHAPWHRKLVKDVDLSNIPYNPTAEEIESTLQAEKFRQEIRIKQEITKLLTDNSPDVLKEGATKIVANLSETSKNDLVHYVALRRGVLDIFKKSLECGPDGKYSSEGIVHDIIFPRKRDSETTSFEDHNLWIVDERLNFTTFVSSDLPLNGANSDRLDLLVYDKRVLFREDNEATNPVHIFEFKKPMRDDFVNPSAKEDPVEQVIRYANQIIDGDLKTPEGRRILVGDNTPFYGYVICDLTKKVEKWLEKVKNFKPMPDCLGWFYWHDSLNLYIEVLSWDKVLKDATMRNKIFFYKLGI